MTRVDSGNYYFQTQTTGFDPCKSPMGMFEDMLIPNDLNFVSEKIKFYYEGDDEIPSLCREIDKLIVEEAERKQD
jgi:hypothetical protein